MSLSKLIEADYTNAPATKWRSPMIARKLMGAKGAAIAPDGAGARNAPPSARVMTARIKLS